MLTVVLAHAGRPPAPHDLAGAWNLDPLLLTALAAGGWLYARGRARGPRRRSRARDRAFAAALAALAVALISPLDAWSAALAAAHMVQHLLLVLAAAPLLAASGPGSTLLRGIPLGLRRGLGATRRRTGWAGPAAAALRQPVLAYGLSVAALWFWHAAVPYDAAVRHEAVHALEHLTLLGSAVLFWRVILGARTPPRVSPGLAVLLLFATTVQTSFLAVLLTFARTPWYEVYAASTAAWGLTPLGDQQLAGVIMWVPAGLVYVVVALGLLVRWLHDNERAAGLVTPSSR